jgi:bacteriorhodopsin
VFAIFTVGLIGVLVIAQRVEKRARLFHWLSALVLTIAMVSYLAMATGLGITYVPIHAAKEASNYIYYRQVYYASEGF